MARKLTLDQKKKAVQIAIDGGDPLPYLKECGSDSPEKIWWSIKEKLKNTQPELYEKIPDRRVKRTKKPDEKPEPVQEGKMEIAAVPEAETDAKAAEVHEAPAETASTEVKIHLNDRVKVKLTVHGIKTYIDHMNAPNKGRESNPLVKMKYVLPTIDDEGYTTFQMWELFSIFGESIHMGADNVINPLEIIKVK